MIHHSQLRELALAQEWPSVTVYVPMVRGGVESLQNDVRLRGALRRTEALMKDAGCSPDVVDGVLKDARMHAANPRFFSHPGDGLALFITREQTRALQLPMSPVEASHVLDHFVVAPLLPALRTREEFFVLALSENQAKLYRAEAEGLTPIPADLPAGMEAALGLHEPETQMHVVSGARLGNRKQGAVFHGQGAGTMHEETDLHAYCRMVCQTLVPIVGEQDMPLALAATERLATIFAEECAGSIPAPLRVNGCPDHWSEQELLDRSRDVMAEYQTRRDETEIAELNESVGRGLGATSPEAVLRAALAGQVHELFVGQGAVVRGRLDKASGEVHLAPRQAADAEDLLDLAVRETLRRGGHVRSVEARLLSASPIAARLRYAAPA